MQYRPHRYPTLFPIELGTPSGPQKAKVVDVNVTGARIAGVRGVGRGDKVHITILSNRVEGVVRWVTNGTIGITFRPAITDHQVDTLRFRRDARPQEKPGRVNFRFVELR